MMEVFNIINVYEINGEETKGPSSEKPKLEIKSHWLRSEMVILKLDDGNSFTVLKKQLQTSIDNATNVER